MNRLRTIVGSPWVLDGTVFILVSAFMAFSAVGLIKAFALALGLGLAMLRRPWRWIPHAPWMILLVGLNLMLHQTTLALDALWLFGVERFVAYLLVSLLIYTLYGDPVHRKTNALKLAGMILVNLGLIGLLFVPSLVTQWRGLSTRLGEYGWLNLVFVSANLMAYLVFVGHVLVEWSWPAVAHRVFPVIRWIAHGLLLGFGFFSQSRAYWLYLILMLGAQIFLKYRVELLSKTSRKGMILIGVLGMALLSILVLRSIPQTATWIATLSNNVTGVSLEGRFWSLIRLVFTDNAYLDASTRERIDLLNAAWLQFQASPWIGQGFGAFATSAVSAMNQGVFILHNGYAHADLFELAASTGLIGTSLYATAIGLYFKKIKTEPWLWVFLAISLGTGLVFRMLFDKAIWWLMLSLIALMAQERDHA